VFAVDVRGRITVFNPAAQRISGVSATDAIGRHHSEVLHFKYEKTGKVNDAFIKKALAGHLTSMANHTVIVQPNGVQIPVADSAAPIRNASGEMLGAIVVFRDVSTEHQLDKAKTEFVSLASHQLRTPLSAINWYGEMLLNGDAGKLNKDQHIYIKEIYEGSQRMVELVNALLDVSRLEIGKLINRPEPTDVRDIVESITKELEVSIKDKKLILHRNILKIPSVTADPKQLRMIVQNLMSNAVKYTTEKDSVSVTLRTATISDMHAAGLKNTDVPHWFFSVQDNGYGIPDNQKSKIFSKLYRADNVRKLDVEGTGLGLYIVKEVVEKMSGKVWFDSTEGKGSTFFVVAPIDVKYRKNDV
jgi:PAS domain S-box-containing protein